MNSINQLRLHQLADSALPVGGASHSFGLEMLVDDGSLTVEGIEDFLRDFLCEAGQQEAVFCRSAHKLIVERTGLGNWLDLNRTLSARKPAREARTGSAAMGRRFLQLVCQLEPEPILESAYRSAHEADVDIHYSTAFGLIGGAFDLDQNATVEAYLHQSVAAHVSACQRLMPLGQTLAAQILWNLKSAIAAVAKNNESEPGYDEVNCFAPMLDIAAMRHATLRTRLFIS